MTGRAFAWAVCLALAGCEESLTLPPAPQPPGPGSLSGRVVVPDAISGTVRPADGAVLRILGTSVATTANDEGRFTLAPVASGDGTLLLQHGGHPDGSWDRQRFLDLASLGAQPGRDVSVGDLSVRENAELRGRVLLADRLEDRTGHRETTIFVPEGPFTTYSGDDGSWLLPHVPEGRISIGFFHAGYDAVSVDEVQLAAGSVVQLRDVTLQRSADAPAAVRVAGRVRADPPTALGAVEARAVAAGRTDGFPVGDDGAFALDLAPGLWSFRFELEGYGPAELRNVAVVPLGRPLVLPEVLLTPASTVPPLVDPPDPAKAPVARAGGPVHAEAGTRVVLDGGSSWIAPGHGATYTWTQTQGAAVALETNGTAEARTGFLAPGDEQRLAFDLYVRDTDTGLVGKASVALDVWHRPAARVTSATRGAVGTHFALDASASSGPAGHALAFAWSQAAGDPVALSGEGKTARCEFVSPATPQTLAFVVRVTDATTGLADEARADVLFDAPPVAVVRAPAAAGVGARVELDATSTQGPPGHALSFSWRQLQGDVAVLEANDSPAAARTAFLAPATPQRLAFEVTVSDVATGLEGKGAAVVDVFRPPQAVVSAPARARAGTRVLLDASGSVAPDGHPLRFLWTQLTGDPVAFSANDTAAAQTEIVAPDVPQTLSLRLRATDTVSGLAHATDFSVPVDIPPVAAAAGPAGAVRVGATVELDATASIAPLAHPLLFSWRQAAGDSVTLSANDSTSAGRTTFQAPARAQTLQFDLTATDTVTLLGATTSLRVAVHEPPAARAAVPPVQRTGTSVQLDGSASSAPAGGTLSYLWTQTAGPAVELSANGSILAARPVFRAPAAPAQLRFTLTVTDVATGLGASTTTQVEVASPPTALIRPATVTVPFGVTVRMDGSASSDASGAPLQFRWSVQGGGALVDGSSDDAVARVQVPSQAASLVVLLSVSNGHLWSDEALASIEVSPAAPTVPTVSAGANRAVDMGSLVTLSADAAPPVPGEVLSFAWAQIDGAPLVTLVDANEATARFFAPGQQALLTFRVTAATEGGASASDDVVIEVVDHEAPSVVESNPAAGMSGSPFFASVRFSEPLDPASVSAATMRITDGGTDVPATVKYDAATRTAKVLPNVPLRALGAYVLHIGAVRDRATPANVHGEETVSYTARAPQWRTWASPAAEKQPVAPAPSVAALSATDVVVGAMRKDANCGATDTGGTWLLVPGAASELVTQPVCEKANPAGWRQHAMNAAGGTFFAMLPGAPTLRRGASGWTKLPGTCAGINYLMSDGNTVFGATWENDQATNFVGSRIHAFGGGDGACALEANADIGDYSGSQSLEIVGSTAAHTGAFMFLRVWNAGSPYGWWPGCNWVYERGSGGWNRLPMPNAWVGESFGMSTDYSYLQAPGLGYVKGSPLMIWRQGASWRSQPEIVHASWYDRASGTWTTPVSPLNTRGNVSSWPQHEIIGMRSLAYYVYNTGGQLYLRTLNLDTTPWTLADVQGPDGVSFNVDAGCTAALPSLAVVDEALFLSWQENCPDGQRIYLRKLH